MKRGKPTVKEIKDELLPKCEEIYAPLFEKFEEDQRFYELDFKGDLDIPTEFANEGIVLPTARDFVDTFVDYIDIDNARVWVNRKGTTQTSEEEAEILRKLGLGLLYMINVYSSIAPLRVAAKHYAQHGLAVIKTVYDADLRPDKPSKKEGESDENYGKRVDEWRAETPLSLPIVWQAVNPRCIMPDPSYGGQLFVIEKHKHLVMDVSKRWPLWKNEKGRGAGDDVEYVSYWDKDYRCDLIDGQSVLKGGVVKHSYGFIPYVLIDSGLGNISYDAKPEMRYVGILRHISDLLISESRNYSIDDIVLAKEAWPWYTVKGDGAAALTNLKHTFGTVTELPGDTELEAQTPAIPPEALRAHLDRTSYYLSAHAAPNVLRGLPEPNVRSGAHERYRAGQAAARYRYSESAFKHGVALCLINSMKIIKNVIPGSVRVWTRTPADEVIDIEVDKNKLHEPFSFRVEFAPISEEDEYRRHDDLIALLHGGVVTRNWARKQMSNVDSIAMERAERKEEIRLSPAYQQSKNQLIATKIQEKIGGMIQPPAPVEPPTTQPPAEPPPGGLVPPIPERAQPGSAQEMQNQIRAMGGRRSPAPMQGKFGGGARGANR